MLQPEVSTDFLSEHWGDIASVAGVVISIVGFLLTIVGVIRSKKAAQRAEEAVNEVKQSILRTDTVMELAAAVTIMEEIKRLHRINAWNVLPDRYSSLKKILVSIRSSNSNLSDDYQGALLSAIQHFTDIEKKVEKALAAQTNPPNVPILNEIVTTQVDKINEVLAAIRQNIGSKSNGR